jgi:predicted nucleic acid-binding protein
LLLVALARKVGADCLVSGDPDILESTLEDLEVLGPS